MPLSAQIGLRQVAVLSQLWCLIRPIAVVVLMLVLVVNPARSDAQDQDQLRAHGLVGRNTVLWGRMARGSDEQLWGELTAAVDIPCYNPPGDRWVTIPTGDTVLIYDRAAQDGSGRPWLHVNAFWNDNNPGERTQTVFGFGGPQVNCYIPFWMPAGAPVAPAPTAGPVQVIRVGSETDAQAWARALSSAPVARESQWTPPGVQSIGGFTASLRVPPLQNAITEGVAVTGAGSWGARQVLDPATDRFVDVPAPWYQVFLGRGPFGFPQATLGGALGDDDFTRVTQPNDCELSADGLYCASWQESQGSGYETFFGLTVGEMPAVVRHSAIRVNSPDGWNVTWYDATVDATYQFSAYLCDEDCGALDLAARFNGSRDMTPNNRAAAVALTQFAATFVEVRL